ncbi:MAG: protein translocase subunit SecD [Candidatus Tectomicrobia bacterium]|uniref:Protein translocase subunit SecD n=1 Tax=Tectimicrobiota bacterium TaxID=2528274 RepID=A0A932GN72_UNCTE|nr:protein translocase subunit SecD [Candidatus Tectomicrobia bacterium]
MLRIGWWKIALIVVVLGASLWWTLPLSERIKLGLDLKGGSHLLMEVESDKAVENTLERYGTEIGRGLERAGVSGARVERQGSDRLAITIPDASARSELDKMLLNYPQLQGMEGSTPGRVVLGLPPDQAKRIKANAVDQGLETIRNRIDQFGVAEPTVQRQGDQEIVVQLPGLQDPERAINLIGKTAVLEFRLLDEENSVSKALAGEIPPDSEILYEKVLDKVTGQEIRRVPYLVQKKVKMTGEYITNAEVRIDQRFNEPYVSLSFDRTGGRIFSQITEENVKKRLAIILDGNVYSAPVIQEKISGGQAQITGNFTPETAHDLAIVLRSGALPAPVKVLENRTVGPSLGADSIRQGVLASFFGGLAVLLFMILYYRFGGLVANLALFFNILILLGVMGYFRATLTLPGIAGIALTIGMAVDANVLIFERIREELRGGKTIRTAVDAGFHRAFLTIVDSNVTTLIAAIFLFQFGSGPVKGFAVTLTAGLTANVFTAVFVGKVMFDSYLARRKVVQLSI